MTRFGLGWIWLVFVSCLGAAAAQRPATLDPTDQSWLEHDRAASAAASMLEALRQAADWGLNPRDYAIMDTADHSRQFDADLTRVARRFVEDLHYGRIDPRRVGFDLPAHARDLDLDAVVDRLKSTSDTRSALASVEPGFRHYQLLKQQLIRYRELAAVPGLTQLPALGARSVATGEPYEGLPQLRRLLIAVGDLHAADQAGGFGNTLDAQTIEALRRFQLRHGLLQDGVLGRHTYLALTTPMAERVRQIELTLERWRWMPRTDAPTIMVNIPQFRLFAFESGDDREDRMVAMNVIVGQAYPLTRTPVFAGDMRYVVFRPYWDVPYGIMSREMLPLLRKRPDYLETHDLEIVGARSAAGATQHAGSSELAGLLSGELRLRQRPGPLNALGPVKFMLPNPHNVYLHATPAQELFKESRRAFSHGCIRVSDPLALAQYVLRQASGAWNPQRIAAAMEGPQTLRVDLERPIRVLIVYGTAVAAESGRIYFFEDLYGNDARLTEALRQR